MPFKIPEYIINSGIQEKVLRFEWDDWKLEDIFDSENRTIYDLMSGVSFRANIAFTNACGEWIIHRFGSLSNDMVPIQNMEAAWAGLIDPIYSVYWEPPDEDWLGPIRGALSLSIIFSLEAIGDTYHYSDPAVSAFRASNLTEHVLSQPKKFQAWRTRIVERLRQMYPIDDDDPLGDAIPREALDPEFDFRKGMTEKLVNSYLSDLDPKANPFLRTPEEMLEFGFKGKPYQFDIKEDRVARKDY